MKKIALLAFSTILLFSCSRKQNPVEPKGTLAKYATHCYNGMLDGNEISIDCGGECGPCNFAGRNECRNCRSSQSCRENCLDV